MQLLDRCRDELIAAPLAVLAAGAPERSASAERSAGAHRDELVRMIDAWLGWVELHPDASRLLFTPIRGDEELERVQRELYLQQRDTQVALLRQFAPGLSEADAEPLAEITRAGFAAIALWWLNHPDRPRAAPRQALLTMALGIVSTAG